MDLKEAMMVPALFCGKCGSQRFHAWAHFDEKSLTMPGLLLQCSRCGKLRYLLAKDGGPLTFHMAEGVFTAPGVN